VSWASVRTLPPSRPAGTAAGRGSWRGCAFASSRYLTRLLSVTLLCQAGAGALTALNVVAVTCDLHGTARTYGAAEALMGAGYVAGAAAAGRLVRAAGPRAVTCGGLFAAAVLTAGYALARDAATGRGGRRLSLTTWRAAEPPGPPHRPAGFHSRRSRS
jgi:hypothetical protein